MAPRIVLIDDLVPAQWLVSTFLSGANCDVISSADPDQAVALARQTKPDAIVLDPALDDHRGWELLAKLQSDPVLSRIPTVIYTALPEAALADHSARCLYGDLRFVSKFEDLDSLLNRIVEAVDARSLAEARSA